MKRLALLLPLVACGISTPDSTEHVGTWERTTLEGVERLTLGNDGSFKLHAPDMPQFGPDVDYVTGTYVVVDGQELRLTGTSSDGTAIEAEFTFAAAGDTFVRGATLHEGTGDHWFGHYRVKIGDQQAEQLWTIKQAPDGWFWSEEMTADTELARYDLFTHEGSWEQRGDEVWFTYGDRQHAEVEIEDGERRGVKPSLATCGIRHGASPGEALVYTRAVRLL